MRSPGGQTQLRTQVLPRKYLQEHFDKIIYEKILPMMRLGKLPLHIKTDEYWKFNQVMTTCWEKQTLVAKKKSYICQAWPFLEAAAPKPQKYVK